MRTPLTTWAISGSFLDLGLELEGEGSLEGAWLDKLVGLNDVKTSLAFFRVPDGQGIGQANIELVKYHRPPDENGIQELPANTLGIRHIAFAVEDIEAVVARLKEKGTEPSARYTTMKACISSATFVGMSVAGAGIILELAEQIS